MSNDRRVSSFGGRRKEPEDDPTILQVQLPPVKLVLEVDREMLLELGGQIEETVYNAAMAGLQNAIEDFAAGKGDEQDDGPDDGGDVPSGLAEVTNNSGRDEPVVDHDQARERGGGEDWK